ncbi:MAG TPA: glutamine-hydrolyzing GMP synthase, partial [Spirochaetota bacterium]|nr:glutamine-hydrolyzing GMP synthase [Spirochaetota bacterium]
MIEHGIGISSQNKVLILDFGSQYTQLIARKIRELHVYAEIVPYTITIADIKKENPGAIVLSGGPSSLYEDNAPHISDDLFSLGLPVLGICYGLYAVVNAFHGIINPSPFKEYGRATITLIEESPLFKDLPRTQTVWMSHGDTVERIPETFKTIARSENAPHAAIENREKKIYGVQFHPEVYHTQYGKEILRNFLFTICNFQPTWTMQSFIDAAIDDIRTMVKNGTVLLGLSGGVDSSVTAVLLQKAIGDRLYCVFVNNGLLRKDEHIKVIERF